MKKRFPMNSALLGLAALSVPSLHRSRTARFYTDDPDGGGGGATAPGGVAPARAAPTLEQLQAQVAELTGKFGSTQKERDALAAKLQGIEDAQLSETEKLKKQTEEATGKAAAAEAKVRETLTRLEIERGARRLNILDEDAAYRLLDASAIQYDDHGSPTNVGALLDALVKGKPFLVGDGSASTGDGISNPGRARGGGTLTAADLAKMSQEQISKLPREQVLAALAA